MFELDEIYISGTFISSFYDLGKNFEKQNINNNVPERPLKIHTKSKKNLSKIDKSFFMSKETLNSVIFTIGRLENIVNSKSEIDQLWLEVKNLFLFEMGSLPELPTSTSKNMKRKFRKSKIFWNNELEKLWIEACEAEKKYLNFKVNSNVDFPLKNLLRTQFKSAQKHFDKKYRYFQRQNKSKEHSDLQTSAKTNPAAMWAQLKRLNNPPTARAALEIIRDDENI